MKIFFDYQIFYLQKYGGISNYFYNLSLGLKKKNNNIKIFSPIFKNMYGKKLLDEKIIIGKYINNYPKYTGQIINLINNKTTNYYLKKFNPEILHMTYYNNSYSYSKNSINFLTIYDLIHEKFPNYYSKPFLEFTLKKKKNAINKADHIICISENTKRDLINYYNVSEKKITTIYLGVDQDKEKPTLIKKDKKFILYVGDRSKYKNFKNLLIAYSSSKLLSENFYLMCFGGGKFNQNEKNEFKNLRLSENNIIQVFGDDKKLFSYYASAECLVIPSLYEGFGLPLIEAMSLDCPVICSKTSSLLEIGSDAVIYFDPYKVEDIKNKIEQFILDSDNKTQLSEKAKNNVKLYTWHDCVERTLELYKKKLNYLQ
jgi:glycosyltransferase involved in cell wall biosynthesis